MKRRFLGILIILFFSINSTLFASEFRFSPRPNRAHLIKWMSWGEKVFERAKKEGKLILLSLSAVWCHWCHVMDETTYSEQEIIDFINGNFIPVRVDSDRRPDIDSLYNQGGWPSTVILTPDGEILSGATYLPPERMLRWLKDNVATFRRGDEVIANLNERLKKEESKSPFEGDTSPEREDIERIFRIIKEYYDPLYGGFGGFQKFPNPYAIGFLLSYYNEKKDKDAEEIIKKTLDKMASGEIHDKVEGGFFRYSTRPDWSEPHYEKMLGENAAIITNYLNAYRVFETERYLEVALKSIEYIKGHLYDEKRAFFWGSQDADERYYQSPNRKTLRPPSVDKTFYADSSAKMVSALMQASQVTGSQSYLHLGKAVMASIMRYLYSPERGVYHSYYDGQASLSGLLKDNTLVLNALIDLYETTGDKAYLKRSEEIAKFIMRRFIKGDMLLTNINQDIVNPVSKGVLKDYTLVEDNYLGFYILNRYNRYGKDGSLKDFLDHLSRRLSRSYEKFNIHAGLYGIALKWYLNEPVEIKIVNQKAPNAFLKELNKIYLPLKTIGIYNLDQDSMIIKKEGFPLQEALYICYKKVCSKPVRDPSDIRKKIETFLGSFRKISQKQE